MSTAGPASQTAHQLPPLSVAARQWTSSTTMPRVDRAVVPRHNLGLPADHGSNADVERSSIYAAPPPAVRPGYEHISRRLFDALRTNECQAA
jgi:hypothetical protein